MSVSSFSAALCRGLIEALYTLGTDDIVDAGVFRGSMPRPH